MRRISMWIMLWSVSGILMFGAGTIKVLQPKAGSTVRSGTQLKIKWTVTGISGVVDINLRDRDRRSQVTLRRGVPASGSPVYHLLDKRFKSGRYVIKVVQGGVVGKSGIFTVLPASEADFIPPRPGNPVHTLAKPPPVYVLKDTPGVLLVPNPRIKSFSNTLSAWKYPGYTSFEYEVTGADTVQLFQRNFAQPIWTSTQSRGTIAVPVDLEEHIVDNIYRSGHFEESYELVASTGNRKDSMKRLAFITSRYPDVIVRQRDVKPVVGRWGGDAVLYYRFANALEAEISPQYVDPADPFGGQKYVVFGNNGAEVSGSLKVKIHGGNGWKIRLKRMDKVSRKEFSTGSGYAAPPEVKGFSASTTRIPGPRSVDFSVHFAGARSADLIEETSGKVVRTFSGQQGAEVKTSHPVMVSQTGFYRLDLRLFKHLVKSKPVQVVVDNLPAGGYQFTVKRDGGIFPGPDVTLTYEVHGQDFLKFYYQASGDPDPRTSIKEFTNLRGANTRGSFKHRPSGFPARYKVIIKDSNGLMKILYYTAN